MTENTTVIERPDSAEARQQSTDRRRPGRAEYANPDLIALLRTAPFAENAAATDAAVTDSENPLATAKGIGVGILLAIPLWALIGLAARFVLLGLSR